ncbi:MAG: glycosyltransferase family 4 protein [Acidobacteriaceae bacterium]|nr:glycosyltransferase family 4 protein [Acidobacteriaceae bacterium]
MKSAVIIVLNPFLYDSRVLRQAEALVRRGHPTTVFSLHEGKLATDEARDGYRLRRFRLKTRPWPKRKLVQGIKYLECMLQMTWTGVRLKPDFIHANDIDALPIGYLIAKIARSKLIYDSHELWSDPTCSEFPNWVFKIVTAVEAFLARRADAVITVNDSIARTMAKEMDIPVPAVIRNVPKYTTKMSEAGEHLLRRALGLAPGRPIILYIGRLASGRGLETLIDAMAFVNPRAVAVLMGPPESAEYLENLKNRGSAANVSGRVLFHPPVAPAEVNRYATDATIGVCPIENTGLNFHYCLPNKIFECLQAGLPLVVTDLPEMSSLVRQYGVGETFPDRDANALAHALNHLLSSPTVLAEYRARVSVAAHVLTWSNEEPKLLKVYDYVSHLDRQIHNNLAPEQMAAAAGTDRTTDARE